MALSFADWYRAYAAKNGVPLSAGIQSLLDNNTITDPSYELNHQRLMGQLGSTAGTYNSARETAAQGARTSAWNQGLSDETQVQQDQRVAGDASIGTGDSISYKIKMGPDGRAYRQAYLNTGAQFGARRWGGSDERATQWRARQDLNAQRDNLITGLSTKQGELTSEQGQKEGGLITDLSKNAGDYSSWKVQNAPAAPSAATDGNAGADPAGDTPAPAAADRYRGVQVGGVLGTYAKQPNVTALNKRWGGGNYNLKNVGTAKAPKYQVIRTR